MTMAEDIRDKPYINEKDVMGLNFIKVPGIYVFRRHYRQGLRSHIMEVLDRDDMEKESRGLIIDGIRWFPRAKPLKMLRIFRTKFYHLNEALDEVGRVKTIVKYLGPEHLALSDEFLVDYITPRRRDFVLCGLQDFVDGEILDPWNPLDKSHLISLWERMGGGKEYVSEKGRKRFIQIVTKNSESFINKVKKMIYEANHVPDLAGVGNLILTPSGDIKLVDINNISKVTFESAIRLDDKGYPVCDKSIEALSLLEQKLLHRPINMGERIYGTFLDPQRMDHLRALEREFHISIFTP